MAKKRKKKKKKGEGANPQEKKTLKVNNKTKGIRGTESQVQRGGQRYSEVHVRGEEREKVRMGAK